MFLRLEKAFDKIVWFTSPEAQSLIQGSEKTIVEPFENIERYQNLFDENTTLVFHFEKRSLPYLTVASSENRVIGFVLQNEVWKLKDCKQVVRSLEEWKACSLNQTWGEQLLTLTGFQMQTKYGVLKKKEVKKIYDIGFNWQVGPKWKSKQLPEENWKQFESALSGKYKICWQQGMDNLEAYIDWLSSCRLIITTDSLGLHLAIALGIPVISYFSVTSPGEIDHHESVSFLQFYPSEGYDKAVNISTDDLLKRTQELLG